MSHKSNLNYVQTCLRLQGMRYITILSIDLMQHRQYQMSKHAIKHENLLLSSFKNRIKAQAIMWQSEGDESSWLSINHPLYTYSNRAIMLRSDG